MVSNFNYLVKNYRFLKRIVGPLLVWQRLLFSPARHNELLNLELLWLGNLCTGKELIDLVWAKDPSTMFLAETWVEEARLKELQRNLNYENMFFVPRNNRVGGLVLYRRNTIDVEG